MPTRTVTVEEHAAGLARRAQVVERISGDAFRAAVGSVLADCRAQIQTMFSERAVAPGATGLLEGEQLSFPDATTAVLENVAVSADGYRYAYVVHQGLPPRQTPTRLNGRGAYVWLTDPTLPRPTSRSGWEAARRLPGLVIFARHLAARSGKPWRQVAVERNRHTVAEYQQDAALRAFSED